MRMKLLTSVLTYLVLLNCLLPKIVIAENKVTDSIYVNTKIDNDFNKLLVDKKVNSLEIIDKRTSFNGMRLVSNADLSKIKIRVYPCKNAPFSISESLVVLGDCFEITGMNYQFEQESYLVFPKKIFKNVKQNNFGQHNDSQGGINLWSWTKTLLHGSFLSGGYIRNERSDYHLYLLEPDKANEFKKGKTDSNYKLHYSRIDFDSTHHFIGLKDRDKHRQKFGEVVGYLCGDIYKKNNKIYLENQLLEGISGTDFKQVWKRYIRNNTGIYYIDITPTLGHHGCSGILSINKVTKLDIVKSPMTFEFLKPHQRYARDKFHTYEVNSGVLTILKEMDSTFEPVKVIQDIRLKNGGTYFTVKYHEIDEILEKHDSSEIKIIYRETQYNKDKTNIFYGKTKIRDVDYESFEAIHSQLAIDKNSIYFRDKKVPRVGEIKLIGSYIKDSNHVYKQNSGEIDERFDAKTFEYVNKFYLKDKSGVYFNRDRLKQIDQVDPDSFNAPKASKHQHNLYAKDKNSVCQ